MGDPQECTYNLLIFHSSGLDCAFPLEAVREIVPMARLSCPPGLPSGLAGFLDLRGTLIPTVRLDWVFDLPEQQAGLHTPMIVLRGVLGPIGILVDSVRGIVPCLAELMGGRIDCTSVGEGSTFSFTAPFAIRKAMETSEFGELAAIAIPPLGPTEQQEVFRFLIAEDSEDNLVLLEGYLKDRGFELDVAKNGMIAVEKMLSGNPHLMLVDVQMPVMDGLEATRVIRGWEVKTHAHPIPILALTAHAGEDAVRMSLQAGCTEHLTKPIKKTALLEAISPHIGRKIHITPPEGVEGLVPKYLANVRRGMNEIIAGVDSQDCKIARRLGHQFKGTGEGYGLPEITRAGAALEVAAMADNEDEIRTQIRALALYLDRVEIVMAPPDPSLSRER